MQLEQITDWNTAYDNVNHIPGGVEYPAKWQDAAKRYREAATCELNIPYGQSDREVFDLFFPEDNPAGLFIFVHGGYWIRFDKSYWSHFAKGFNEAGWAVAMPSYSLCPDVALKTIEDQVAAAVAAAALKVAGPIILSGHSAGGQLVSSLVTESTSLDSSILNRIEHVLSVSGVHDLRPLLHTTLNQQLNLNEETAVAASPALKRPISGTKLTALVGSDERPEFLRQNTLLANMWMGLGARVSCVEAPGKHHFNVIEHLVDDAELIAHLSGSAQTSN